MIRAPVDRLRDRKGWHRADEGKRIDRNTEQKQAHPIPNEALSMSLLGEVLGEF